MSSTWSHMAEIHFVGDAAEAFAQTGLEWPFEHHLYACHTALRFPESPASRGSVVFITEHNRRFVTEYIDYEMHVCPVNLRGAPYQARRVVRLRCGALTPSSRRDVWPQEHLLKFLRHLQATGWK